MKHSSFLLVCSLVLALTGCAGVGPLSDASPSRDAALPAPTAHDSAAKPQRQPAQYPTGELSAIVANQDLGSSSVATLSAPFDLWERIRRGFAMPDLQSELVRDREQWYASRPDYIARMTERSRKYLFHIVEELERRNMPTELALLPFIESAFNPQAVSSAKAAGMWQFMPATGKYFELKQNAFRDDRRDVLASTRAALDYLQKLHGMFGDWHLALAAYNWGEGSVGRAIGKNQRAGLGTSYLELSMPMETRLYVPKLQAVKNIVGKPEQFQVRLPLIENHPYFDSVTITRDIDMALVAKLAEVPLEDLKALNPSHNKPVLLAAGTPQVLLPWDNAAIFQRNLEAFTGTRLASWTVWVAPGTMRVAEAAKRVGMSEDELRSVNRIPPRMLVRAGSSLLVARHGNLDKDVTGQLADNGQLSLAPESNLRRTLVKAGKKDTVASLAKRHKLSADSVAEWNNVAVTASLKAGQQVVLYLPGAANRVAAKGTPPNPKKTVAKRSPKGKATASTQLARR